MVVYSQEKSLSQKATHVDLLERMSYEVKDALNSIIGFSKIVKKTCQNKKQLEHIANILNSSEKLLVFTNNMNDVSKVIDENYQTHNYSFSLKKLLEEVINSFNVIINKKKICVKLETSELKIKSDNKVTSQIFYGLFNHLIKATPQNGFIQINAQKIQDEIIINIHTGIIKTGNKKKYTEISDILTYEKNICSDMDLFLVNKLTLLTGGKISFKTDKNNSYKIKISLPENNNK
jgi:signal transduction histidine kinase